MQTEYSEAGLPVHGHKPKALELENRGGVEIIHPGSYRASLLPFQLVLPM